MRYPTALVPVFVVLGAAASFVWISGQSLPAVVASHFGFSGAADGTTSRQGYVVFMAIFVVALPLAMVGVAHLFGRPGLPMNLPNVDYWLAPRRRARTVDILRCRMLVFAAGLCLYLCYVHWLVVRANTVQPAHLSNVAMYGGLAVFLLIVVGWVVALHRRFRLPA